MIINFYMAAVLTLLAEHHLNTGWLVHVLLSAGVGQIVFTMISNMKKGE